MRTSLANLKEDGVAVIMRGPTGRARPDPDEEAIVESTRGYMSSWLLVNVSGINLAYRSIVTSCGRIPHFYSLAKNKND